MTVLQSCDSPSKKKLPENFDYYAFKDSIKAEKLDTSGPGFETNIFENTLLTPDIDSANALLTRIDSAWHREMAMVEQVDSLRKIWKKMETHTPEELLLLKENTQILDSFLTSKKAPEGIPCSEAGCLIYAHIVKSTQTLYLYLDAVLIDSFAVSTGIGKYDTPTFNVRAAGPTFKRYTSKKFPGGNYEGLGNMPYVVFIKGGYAVHGTTTGNFEKLGTKASHGCVRLHPMNAKIFYELVSLIGLSNTWISITES
ncbi:L,D-transpeptidase [Arcticibacterium luteifluviistationis]|nr:L,D-transpeptidase [Arcticibacterium luteifluviistationis]